MRVLLGYLALVIFVLGVANYIVFNTTGEAAVPIYVSHPLGMLAAGFLLFVFVIPTLLGQPAARVLPPAGTPLATFRSGGRMGRVNFSSKLIKVTVYADRLTLKPPFVGEYTIHGSEIRSITDLGGMLFRRVRIEHAGAGLFSRVTLNSVPDEVRAWLGHVRRAPLPPGPRTPVRRQAVVDRRITTLAFVVAILVLLGLVAFGITQFARYDQAILLVWSAAPLVVAGVVAWEFVKFRRRG